MNLLNEVGAVVATGNSITPANGGWMVDGVLYVAPGLRINTAHPAVSCQKFWLLFTSPERVAIRTARKTDAGIDDFMLILEDPKTIEVDLSIPAIQGAVAYCISKSPVGDVPHADRVAAILSGQIA